MGVLKCIPFAGRQDSRKIEKINNVSYKKFSKNPRGRPDFNFWSSASIFLSSWTREHANFPSLRVYFISQSHCLLSTMERFTCLFVILVKCAANSSELFPNCLKIMLFALDLSNGGSDQIYHEMRCIFVLCSSWTYTNKICPLYSAASLA